MMSLSSIASSISRGRNQQQVHMLTASSRRRRRRQCLFSWWSMMMMMMNVGILVALVILWPNIGVSGLASSFSVSKQSCMLYSSRGSRRLSSCQSSSPVAPCHSSWTTLHQTLKGDDQEQQQQDVQVSESSSSSSSQATIKEPVITANVQAMRTQKEKQEESSPPPPPLYPIDLPSPILLGSAIFLAIAATGSLFQVFLGDGTVSSDSDATAVSLAIGVIGLPIAIFLFYASILKAQVETQEDDDVFLGRGGGKKR